MIKVGIIGCGMIAKVRHAPEYAANENVEIAGYYDVDPAKAQALADTFGGKIYEDLDELLASGVDAVSVCVANALHAEVSVKAMEAGCHVLCEKPMATTPEDCDRMVATAKETGRKLMIGQNQRFADAHAEARRRIAAGAIGRPLSFETKFEHAGPEAWSGQKNPWFFDKKRSVFGAMADLGVHKTDLMHFLLGEPITRVSAILTTLDKTYPDGTLIGVDDNAYCLYTTASGVTGTLHVSWTQYGVERNSTIIQGTKGTLRLYDDPVYTFIQENADGTVEKLSLGTVGTNEDQTSGRLFKSGVIDAFVDSILRDETPAVSGEDAIRAMRVVFAAERSSQTGGTVTVEQEE